IRPIAALITAITAGFTEDFLEKRWPEQQTTQDNATSHCESKEGCCDHADHDHSHAHAHDAAFMAGLRHAFIDIFDDVVGWMLISFVIAGAINIYLGDLFNNPILANPYVAMLILLAIGVPMFVCAEASTPIAAALIAKGVSPGAALVFLLSGPA